MIGATLKISKYYEASLSHSVPRVHLAISAMTSTLRAEPNKTLDPGEESGSEEDLESVLLNMSGKILMIHRLSTVTTETGRKKVRRPLLQRTVRITVEMMRTLSCFLLSTGNFWIGCLLGVSGRGSLGPTP